MTWPKQAPGFLAARIDEGAGARLDPRWQARRQQGLCRNVVVMLKVSIRPSSVACTGRSAFTGAVAPEWRSTLQSRGTCVPGASQSDGIASSEEGTGSAFSSSPWAAHGQAFHQSRPSKTAIGVSAPSLPITPTNVAWDGAVCVDAAGLRSKAHAPATTADLTG